VPSSWLVKLKQKLESRGPATAISLTDAEVGRLGGGRRAAVTVTIGRKTARLRLGVMGGKNLIGISKANREALGVEIGDTVTATIELDAADRTAELPGDAAKALAKAKLRKVFDALAPSHQKEHVRAITEAKKPATRANRIAAMVEKLRPSSAPPTERTANKTAKTSARAVRAKALHRKALKYNWDDGVRKLSAIVGDKACDLGTALAIYWMGAPGFDQQWKTAKDLGAGDWRLPVFTFLRALEKRIIKRDFATADILFNPRFDRTTVDDRGHDWTAEYGEIKAVRPIPAALKEPSRADPAWEARRKKPIKNTANRLT